MLVRDANSTTALLMRLFDNYELDVAVAEHSTPEQEQEQHDFLRAVMNTRVMKLTMRFLVNKGRVRYQVVYFTSLLSLLKTF